MSIVHNFASQGAPEGECPPHTVCMGFFDSGSVGTRVGAGLAVVAAASMFAGGLWWDQARVDDALSNARASQNDVTEPRTASSDVSNRKAPAKAPNEPTPEVDQTEPELPAPDTEVATETIAPPPVEAATAIPTAPARPATPRVVAPSLQQPVQQAPIQQAPIQQSPVQQAPVEAPAQPPAEANDQGTGTPTDGGQTQDGETTHQGVIEPARPLWDGGVILDRVFDQLAR